MAQTLNAHAQAAPSPLRTFALALLAVTISGAVIVAAIVFASFNGFDLGLKVFTYLISPAQELIQPAFDALLPADLDGPEAGVALLLLSAWAQVSVIVGGVLVAGWAFLAMFRATGRQ